MKKSVRAILSLCLCTVVLGGSIVSVDAADLGPYTPVENGCITKIEMKSQESLANGAVNYFTSTVTSHIQGLETRDAIPYNTYGAIGSDKTKLFVYSVGKDSDLDYAEFTTKQIVEQFEKDNPAYNAIAAVNGDFFDIESKITPTRGEPEGPMVQNGQVLKAHNTGALGRGILGTTSDGKLVYHTFGSIYAENGYGVKASIASNVYALEVLGEHRTNAVKEYRIFDFKSVVPSQPSLLTPDDAAKNTSGKTVCVVKCDKYRRAHTGINGAEMGTQGYFALGEITEIRDGKADDKPEKGYVLIVVPNIEKFEHLKKGTYVRIQAKLAGAWEDVENAIGFKQQILAEGTILLKNAYGTYNQTGDEANTRKWSEDVYDYPHCWKQRTVIGFKADGTPMILVIQKSHSSAGLGASYYEMGEHLKSLGCTNGFVLDGGGSSSFVKRNADGTFTNVFVGENGNTGRKVANAVILAVRDESVPLPEEDPLLDPPKNENKETEITTDVPVATETIKDMIDTEPPAEKDGCGSAIALPTMTVGAAIGALAFGSKANKRKKKSNR